ncbi:MAG: SprT-like domain-containing protein [Phycisphaeraceae bacterium]
MEAREARQLALDLMGKHGLLQRGWTFQWSRGKRQLGAAEVRRQRDPRTGKIIEQRTIKLSRHLVALNDEAEVRETILHEIAHAIAGVRNGHNEVWKSVCRRIGAKPQRLAGETVATVEPRYTIVCGRCDRSLGKRHRRVRPHRLARTYCAWCGRRSLGMLRLEERPSPQH